MSAGFEGRQLPARDLEALLAVTRALAAPFDLRAMLDAVVDAAKQVLRCDRGSVWLHDPATEELVLEVATDIRQLRVPLGTGLVGACARSRVIINVPDCYADPRFDPAVDRRSGYRTRCMLTMPLIDHRNALVGVMQLLNKEGCPFDGNDERLAMALAAQCAVALQRVRMTEAVIEGEKMRQSLEMARDVQMSTLPRRMPDVGGYDVAARFRPADLTGGDTFDLSLAGDKLLVVLGDASGHGIAPALSITQMHAMLRMALALNADLATAYFELNNRLVETLPGDRFITAFIGVVDVGSRELQFLSGGQGPILHFDAASRSCRRHKPTTFPLGAMRLERAPQPVSLDLGPGDILILASDGIFEQPNPAGLRYGEDRVVDLVAAHHAGAMDALLVALDESLAAFSDGAPQEDDMTVVLVKRNRGG
ncbi:MAG TPA: GAF domain-containing SpoIIE family protein phosphatase [Casimicrobiaceae bacterium]|nr:GAF domain-containing SpoIIE family protein phosphatase [Casimicrobiaceae bacterium]